jgi:hypothetical protein
MNRVTRAHLARFRRHGSLSMRQMKRVNRVQVLGGPMHGYTLLLSKRGCAVLDTNGRRARLNFGESHDGYDWQTLPSGEQRFVCRTAPRLMHS